MLSILYLPLYYLLLHGLLCIYLSIIYTCRVYSIPAVSSYDLFLPGLFCINLSIIYSCLVYSTSISLLFTLASKDLSNLPSIYIYLSISNYLLSISNTVLYRLAWSILALPVEPTDTLLQQASRTFHTNYIRTFQNTSKIVKSF